MYKKLLIMMIFAFFLIAAPLLASLTVVPGIEVEIINKTTLTLTTDVQVAVKINNTKLAELHGEDVYTIAIFNYQFRCSVRGEKSAVFVIQTPIATRTFSFSQETMNICLGDETRITKLNATFLVISRGGRHLATYYADFTKAVEKLVYVPEWKAVTFKIEIGHVDRCNWVHYNLRARYGGDIGIIKITSWDCFNNSKALRVAYQPYYHYLTKYIKVVVRLELNNATLERELTGGDELIISSPEGPYGEVKNFTIEVAGPEERYLLRPMEHVGHQTNPTTC